MPSLTVSWPAIALFLTAFLGLYAWVFTQASQQRSLLEQYRGEQDKRFTTLETKIATITERVGHMPTAKEVGDLNAAVRELTGSVKAVAHKLELYDEHFMGRPT